MRTTTRRAFLATAGTTVAVSGCSTLGTPQPPDVEWRFEEEPDVLRFVHDGGESIEEPHELVVVPEAAEAHHRSPSGRPKPETLGPFRPHFVKDDEVLRQPPERLTETDQVVADSYIISVYYEDGVTFELLWRDADEPMEVFDPEGPEAVLASHELENQRSEPPQAEWITERQGSTIRFVHDGGEPVRVPESGESHTNEVVFRKDDWERGYMTLAQSERGWVREGDAIEFHRPLSTVQEELRLVWMNRHRTNQTVLARYRANR